MQDKKESPVSVNETPEKKIESLRKRNMRYNKIATDVYKILKSNNLSVSEAKDVLERTHEVMEELTIL